jgi:hypothetical protein
MTDIPFVLGPATINNNIQHTSPIHTHTGATTTAECIIPNKIFLFLSLSLSLSLSLRPISIRRPRLSSSFGHFLSVNKTPPSGSLSIKVPLWTADSRKESLKLESDFPKPGFVWNYAHQFNPNFKFSYTWPTCSAAARVWSLGNNFGAPGDCMSTLRPYSVAGCAT